MRCEICGCTLFSCQCPGCATNPLIEPIPDDCLPSDVNRQLFRGPKIGVDGKIDGGTYHGMTPAEVLADRDAYDCTLEMAEVLIAGDNEHWRFCVGRSGDRWLGFALCDVKGGQFMNVFPEVSENFQLGLKDREAAIRLTTAIAQDPETGLGGIDHWHVPPELRGKAADYRCARCERLGCNGGDCQDDFDAFDSLP